MGLDQIFFTLTDQSDITNSDTEVFYSTKNVYYLANLIKDNSDMIIIGDSKSYEIDINILELIRVACMKDEIYLYDAATLLYDIEKYIKYDNTRVFYSEY